PGSQSASAESAADLAPVDVVAVSGLIDHAVVDEIETALERSTTNGAQAVVLQVNSRGAIVSPERFAELLKKLLSGSGRLELVHMDCRHSCSPSLTSVRWRLVRVLGSLESCSR
ncbi:MAG: hypothetical protein RLZZ449_1472, partial [Actinomycetota bacterium]